MNFADLPKQHSEYQRSKVVILPVPYDGTASWMKGAVNGPQAIIAASAHLELYDIETDSEVYRQGISTMKPVVCPQSPEEMVAEIRPKHHSINIRTSSDRSSRHPDAYGFRIRNGVGNTIPLQEYERIVGIDQTSPECLLPISEDIHRLQVAVLVQGCGVLIPWCSTAGSLCCAGECA